MEHLSNKMDYFWNTFIGGIFISVGTFLQIKAGSFLTIGTDIKSFTDILNSSLSVVAYILGIISTSITISKFLKERKKNKEN